VTVLSLISSLMHLDVTPLEPLVRLKVSVLADEMKLDTMGGLRRFQFLCPAKRIRRSSEREKSREPLQLSVRRAFTVYVLSRTLKGRTCTPPWLFSLFLK